MTKQRNFLKTFQKRLFAFFLVFAFLGENTILLSTANETKNENDALQLNCKASVIIDVDSGKVLHQNNGDARLSPASLTKIMSVILVMEAIENGSITYETKVSCSPNAAKMGGSQIWLEPNEEMTVDELLRGAMIGSANDATVALAEAVAGTEEAFVEMMNLKASNLQLKNTNFKNAAGLDEAEHYASALDISVMAKELLSHKDITKYSVVWMDSLRGGKTALVNTNKLVRFYEGITGLKTGTTGKAGNCLVASAKRDNLHIAAIIMGCTNNDDRYGGARKMLDFAFANYTSFMPEDISAKLKQLKVLKGVKEEIQIYCPIDSSFAVKKSSASKIDYKISVVQDVAAPVEKDQIVGNIKIMCDSEQIGEYSVKTAESVEKITFFKALLMLLKNFVAQ